MATPQLPNTRRPVTNPSPKARFLESNDNISKHRTLLESNELRRGFDFTTLQYTAYLGQMVSNNPQAAAFAGLKLSGMTEFLDTFKTLSEIPPPPPTKESANLNHEI